ncbi:serine, glycine, tyrosine and glutamine-rich protein-like [Montipora foliosa]|uniref:serine, glycine, tyrosine and glutamine-rich protein-like n=1 Tax=Montipora foliosa TaxID=591990 RepID=UPI0035F1FABA
MPSVAVRAMEERGAHTGGEAYGSVYRPSHLGSGGGNGSGKGGTGGGQLLWEVGKRLELNGLISARGGNGTGSHSGGGSGGSILIKTTNMTGHGEIAVTGGDATNDGGAGSGGRVGIHCRWRYTYGGKFTDRGGVNPSSDSYSAPAGTVYKEENFRPLEYRILKYSKETNTTFLKVDHTYLHVDNEGRNVPEATVLMEEGTTDYEFDEVELTGYSRLIVYHPNETLVTVIAHKFIGDKTGQFHLRINQTIYVEVIESEPTERKHPAAIGLTREQKLFFRPSSTFMVSDPNFMVR